MADNISLALEKKVINIFDSGIKKNSFQELFGVSLHDFRAEYNINDCDREFDIVIFGKKRLNIGLLVDEPYNIEIETNRCNRGIINKKYNNGLMSMILTNGASVNSNRTRKVYSFVDFRNDYFAPCFLDNYCDKMARVLGKENVAELEKILYSGIDSGLKKGLLYFICDKLAFGDIKKIFFIPGLMQVSLAGKRGVDNLVIDSAFSRQKILNYSLSKSYEQFLNANFNKKLSKSIDSKAFSFITLDSGCSFLCSDSEIDKAIILKSNLSGLGLNDYIAGIKKL